jgi:hypothetical protein
MRLKLKLHKPTNKLTLNQKVVYYSNIKIYNKILNVTAELVSDKKIQLKKYLIDKVFHSLEEYLSTYQRLMM